eukprot:TRINITY_DN52934_c0_g1_i1.p1 TRINITY_DN52934_c0_g1~~TRINITY_DN52934_c0_g1_i1.p1  ORF type:complete len:502 (+),score=94.11 TRINITY_DN52934_c0_g1_i1:48-1553(+)
MALSRRCCSLIRAKARHWTARPWRLVNCTIALGGGLLCAWLVSQGVRAAFALPCVSLRKDLRQRVVEDRHPWLYDRALEVHDEGKLQPGDLVAVKSNEASLAFGLYDPDRPLRVRLLSWDEADLPDEAWAHKLAEAAAAKRTSRRSGLLGCTGLRLLHGENDWTPGVVIDAYDGVGVVAFDGDACEAFWRPLMATIAAAFVAGGVQLRTLVRRGGSRGAEDEVLWGEALPDEPIVMMEHGARFEVDVLKGHKTGFFLDQRSNRRRIRDMSKDKDVLDLFSYTGGFAMSAALGGARRVTAVDAAEKALAAAQRNFSINQLKASLLHGPQRQKSRPAELQAQGSGDEPYRDSEEVSGDQQAEGPAAVVDEAVYNASPGNRLVVADCWAYLEEAAQRGLQFDIVVNDPPSMAPNAASKRRALGAYTRLNALALKVVRPGGILLSCSCSSHITGQDLEASVKQAAKKAKRRLQLEAEERAATDHPVRRGFPEGDYLQALYYRVDP